MIGVHAIFGAFVVGLICPHEGGFAIKVTEKIEDLVTVLFLPLYFALSGLKTDLGLLNDGKTWGYVVGVIACAFAGKIIGGTLAARAMRLVWRESFTIGCLMSCKGLVELIVLVSFATGFCLCGTDVVPSLVVCKLTHNREHRTLVCKRASCRYGPSPYLSSWHW